MQTMQKAAPPAQENAAHKKIITTAVATLAHLAAKFKRLVCIRALRALLASYEAEIDFSNFDPALSNKIDLVQALLEREVQK